MNGPGGSGSHDRHGERNFVSRAVGRLSAFSDAVFATRADPARAGNPLPHEGQDFNAGLRAHAAGPAGVPRDLQRGGLQWLAHYRLFGRIRRIDRQAMNSNLVFLLFSSLLPLSTPLLMKTAAGRWPSASTVST